MLCTLPFHFVLRVRFATTNLVIKISGRLLNYLRVKSYRLWHLPEPRSQSFSPIFSSSNFNIFCFTFKSVIHF